MDFVQLEKILRITPELSATLLGGILYAAITSTDLAVKSLLQQTLMELILLQI